MRQTLPIPQRQMSREQKRAYFRDWRARNAAKPHDCLCGNPATHFDTATSSYRCDRCRAIEQRLYEFTQVPYKARQDSGKKTLS